MKSRRTLFTLVLLAVLLVFGLAQTQPAQAQGTTLYVTPNTPSRGNTCEPTTMYVRVGSVTNLTAYHLELTYDPNQIEITSIENGGFLNATDAFLEPTNTFGADTGRIKWGMAQRGTNGDPDPKNGDGALIEITFQPLVAGVTTTITLDGDNSMLVDWPDAFAIPFTVPADKGAAKYSLTGEVVSNVSASPAVNYCSLITAVTEASDSDELRFLTNFEEFGAAFVNNKALTIDTNGFTATRNTASEFGHLLTVETGGSVTLTGDGALVTQSYGAPLNLSGGGVAVVDGPTLTGGHRSVRVNGDSSGYTWTPTYSTFTLESGNLTNGVIVLGNGATAIINGGTVSRSDGQGAITGNGTVNTSLNYGGTSVTVNGGTINAGTTAAIYQPQSGTLTINGGTINGITSAIEMKRGDLTVTGGTITGAADGILIDNPSGGYVVDGAMTVDISGGVITGTSGYAVRERVPSGGSLRTTSAKISGGDFTGGTEGVIFSDQLLAAASANPPTAVLALTDGRYSHDPDRFVFAPYGSYLESPWYLIDQLVGTIERDPGNTGDIPGWTPLTVTVTGDTIDFLGEIAWYPADESVGRTAGHRVGVEINAPAGFPTTTTTFTFAGNTYTWNDVADGDNFVWIYPKVTAVPQSWDVVVTWKEGVTQTFTINVLTGSKLEPTLSADTFSYVNDPDNARGSLLGVTSNWKTTNVLLNDVDSLKVELFGENENGDEVLLQTNTENMTGITAGPEQFDSPFNIFGKYSYTGSPWNNNRQTEFGQHLPATRVKATMTLHDGRVYTAENTIITGNRADIVPTLNAQDFGYMASSGVKGVTAGFGTQKVTLDQAVSIKVELFTGEVGAYQLLQTNTAIAGTDLFSAITNFSSPFDIFGTFDYPADGYWVNVRETEYGQTAIPTRVLATVELPGQFFMTAENTTLTGDRRTIVSTLDEEIKEAQNYVYDPEYVYTGDKTFDDTSNTYTMMYWPAEYLDGAPMRDLARYLGALYYQDISTVESITYDGVVHTWDVNGTLVGSNWKDANGTTLVSVVVADLLGQYPGTATMTLSDGLNTADVTFVVDVYNTLDDEIASAPSYVYDPVYNYVGTFAFEDATNTYTATYTDVNYNPGALYDLARYLGALHRQAGATIIKITYDNVDYTWDPQGTLLGSNWKDANGTTLVSVVGADFQNGTIVPGTGFTFTVADGIHTETVTFIIMIQDTTPPTVESIVATGATGYDEVTAVGTTLTVDQGYTVDHITVTLSEAVTITDGTVVTMGGVPYGTITANGAVLTIVPYAGNEVASVYGTFEFSVPAGSIKDLAGNPLATTTVTLIVNNVAPVAADDDYTTAEDTPLSIAKPGVLANDTDLDDLTAVLVAGPANGTLTLNADGSFVYTPNANFNGTDTFTYKANDGDKDSNVATVTITVTPVNDAPVAQDITVTTPEDTAIDITLLGTDVDGDALTYTIVGQPANGTLSLVDDVVTYTPTANWHGTDSFTYKVNDGTVDSNLATVTITVTSVNDAPVAQDIEVTMQEDAEIDITLIATDIEGDTLTYAIDTDPGHGTVTIVGNVATYTPDQDYNGTDSFTYTANDGDKDSNVATVTITITPVKDQVVAIDDFYSVNQGQTLTILAPGVYANDKNPDNDPWVVSLKTGVQHGTLSLNQDGGFVYIPDADFYGEDAFVYSLVTYPAIQSMWTDEAKVTITVVPMPIISSDDVAGPYFVGEQQEFHVTLTNPVGGATYTNLSASIFVDDIGLADFVKAEVKHPVTGFWIPLTPVVEGNGLRLVVGPTSNYALGPDATITLTFRVEFNTAGNYTGTGTLFCHDSGTPVEIGSLTDTMVVYARPVISSDDLAGPYIVGELKEFHVTLDNTDGTTYTSMSASIFVDNIGLADFETAEVKHPVTGQWITLTPVVEGTGLRLVVGPTSNYAVGPDDSVTLTFRVEFNTAGDYEATGTLYCHDSGTPVEIGSLTDTMVVYARPVISSTDLAGPYFVGELQEFHVTLDNTNGTTYTSMSASIFVDNIGLADFETAEVKHPVTGQWITLTPVVEGTGLRLVVGPTSNYAVGPDDSVTLTFRVEFNTAGNYTGTGTLFCHDSGTPVEIGSLTDTMVVYARPVISSDDLAGPYIVGELKEFHVTLDNTDGTTYTSMSASIFVDNIGLADFETAEVKHPVTGQWIALTPVVEGTGLRLVVGPTSNYAVGPDDSVTLTFRVEFNTAGTYTGTGTLYCHDSGAPVEIGSLTDTMVVYARPISVDDAYTTPEDSLLTVDAPGILANDTDPEGEDLSAILVTDVSHGTLTLNADGSFTYMPDANWHGIDSFTYKANDGMLDGNVATVTITVTPVNDAPVAQDIEVTTPEDTAIDITLIGTDVDGDALTYAIVDEPTNGSVTIVGNVATYTPDQDWHGTDTFTYKANDGELDSNDATVTITVKPVKDQVRAVDDFYSVDQGQTLTIAAPGVMSNDEDVDNNEWFVTLKTDVAHGTLSLNQDGSFIYTPDASFRGDDSFIYTLVTYPATQSLWTDDAKVTITVNPVYPLPTISSDDIEGPYTVGQLREFNVTLTNPADGDTYTSLSASIFVNNITSDDFSSVEVFHPVAQTWVPLTPVVSGNGLKLDLGPTGNFPLVPGQTVTLTFRVNFNTPGIYPAQGSLFNAAVTPPVEIASFNATLTVNHADNLDEQIAEAPNYVYDPVYNYTGDMTFDATSNTYTMMYWPAEYLDGAPMRDLARYLGALKYQAISTVESLTYKGVVYTWDPNGGLVGSNWKNGDVTLVSVIVADLLGQYPGTATVTLADSLYTADVTFVVDVYNTLDDEIESAPSYVYDPVYNYVGTFAFEDATNTYTATYTDVNHNPGALYDLARYLGALHRQAGATVIKVTYKGVDYTWNPAEPLKGSNWEDANGTTLVSVVGADFQNGTIVPGTGFTFTVADGIHTETVTFILVIQDTTAPEVVSITAIGAEGFADVAAVNRVITVDQGYTVARTEIVLNEDVTVVEGTVVSIGATPYGNITANGSLLTVVPFGSNGIASLPGTFELSVPAGSIKDLAGNAIQDLSVTLVVNNVAPVANDDAYTTDEDVELVVVAPGVLTNDVDWTPLTVSLEDDVAHGTLTLNANGSFTYQPDENWHGTDTFTYTASDGDLESAAATVTITVKPVNDAPVANDDFYTTDEDTVLTVTAPGVLANDYDVDGDNLTVTLKTDVSNGTLILNGDGSFVYTPDENWYGTDSFVYNLISYPNINAEGWTDEATVTITVKPVNDAPVAVDDEYSTTYETALTIAAPGVLANDTDVENSALTATLVAGPANGTVTLNADGSFTYTPAAGFSGTDSFTYTANDGELDSNVATVSIVVTASTNNPPVAVNDTYTTAFGTTLTVTVPGVLGNDTDADNDPLTAIKVSDPLHGTLTFNADGSFTYVPDANFSGIDTFTYKANDGESDSNVATVSILVEDFVNTPPVAQDQSVTTPEDTAIAITLIATDADDDTLSYWIVGQPQHGTLTLAGNVATYTPDQDYNGSDSFTFKANDGTTDSNIATVSITVTSVNDDPVAQDLQVTTPEDTPIDITLIGTDVDGDTLTYEIVDEPLNGTVTLVGNVATYTPDDDYNGTDSFTYKANDGTIDSNIATVTIAVTPVNDAPVAVDDAYTTVEDTLLAVDAPGVLDNDYDVDGDDMTVTLRSDVSHGTLTLLSDGSFTYLPDQDFFGTDSFTYTLLTHPHITSGWTDWATVTITVTPVNDAPVLDEIADATIPEMVEYTFTATATDVDSTDLTFSLIDAPEGAAIDAATGVFTWTPTEAQGPAEYTFTVKVCDDGEPVLCDEQSVTLTVQEVNLAPELDPIEDQEVEVGDELTFTATATDPDLPAQTLLFYLSGAPAGASIDASTGVFNWTPVASQIGEHSFEVCVTDGDLADCQEITVTVLQGFVNTAPVAVADAYEVEYEGVLEVQAPGVLENDSDVDGDPLIALLVSTTSNGTLTFNQDGSFTYVPRAWFSGTDTFTYKANDGELDSNIVTVTITVHPLPVSYFYFPLIFK